MKPPVMIPPSQEPLADATGMCRLIWYLFLDSLRRGGVTHSAGNLTLGSLIVGNGGSSGGDIATGDLTGDVTTTGTTATTLKNVVTASTQTKITYNAKGLVTAGVAATPADVGLGNVTNDAQLKIASNLSDLASAATGRTNLGVDASLTVAGWTVALAKLTTTGTQGSLTVDTHGRITAYTAPT